MRTIKPILSIIVILSFALSNYAQVTFSIWGGMNPDYSELGYCDDIEELEFYDGYVVYMEFYDYSGEEVYYDFDCYWDDYCYPLVLDGCSGVFDLDPTEVDLDATMVVINTCNGWQTFTPDVVTETGIQFHVYACQFGCDDPAADNYDPDYDIGCYHLCEYDPETFCNEGETVYEMNKSGSYGVWGIDIVIEDILGVQVYPNDLPTNVDFSFNYSSTTSYVCLSDEECYLFTATTDPWNGWEGYYNVEGIGDIGSFWNFDPNYEPVVSPYPISCIGMEICDDPLACNYTLVGDDWFNPCCYDNCGCTDPNALNYDSSFTCLDSSCLYASEGLVFYDDNENGIMDPEDYGLPFQQVNSSIGSIYFTNDEGEFYAEYNSSDITFTLVADDSFPFNTTLNPQNLINGINEITDDSSLNFGISNESPNYEICVDFYPVQSGYPCDDLINHNICFRNMGNVPFSGVIEIEYDTLFQGYMEVTPIDSVNLNKVYMSFYNLPPGQMFFYDLKLHTPTVDHIGEFLTSICRIQGILGEDIIAYGESELSVEVTCAYDPNDKQVFPVGYEEPHYVLPETELEYLVRFQNTGNAPATNVIVRDTLDETLDFSTFSLVANSHSVITTLHPEDRSVEFLFENIMLPDSIANEPDSHGLISYKVRPLADLELNTEINNKAYIYFDNNPPIITNNTWTTIYDCNDGLAEFEILDDVICLGSAIHFISNQDYIESYSWELDGSNISNLYYGGHIPEMAGIYDLSLNVINPICEATQSQIVEIIILTGDLDNNGIVNILDLLNVSTYFGMTDVSLGQGDSNGDGVSNIMDLLEVSSNFGTECE